MAEQVIVVVAQVALDQPTGGVEQVVEGPLVGVGQVEVPVEDVPDLVRCRQAFLLLGQFGDVPQDVVDGPVVAEFPHELR
jgi:hypothetical protein